MGYQFKVTDPPEVIDFIVSIGRRYGWRDKTSINREQIKYLVFDINKQEIYWAPEDSLSHIPLGGIDKVIDIIRVPQVTMISDNVIGTKGDLLTIDGFDVNKKAAKELRKLLDFYIEFDALHAVNIFPRQKYE